MNSRLIAVTVVLVLLAGISGWLKDLLEPDRKAESPHTLRHSPDYYLENFTITSMDINGDPRHLLRSDKMVHYPDDDSTELAQPVITIFRETTPPWHIFADRGWVSSDGELVLLRGGVVIDRPKEGSHSPVRLTTNELRIRPEDEYAETDGPVHMVSNGNTTSAIGMRIYLKQGQLQLLNKVRGHYEK